MDIGKRPVRRQNVEARLVAVTIVLVRINVR